ncbi:MAG: hypothetical protein K0R51_2367 [Cytophagaceae bacterium]|jgi:hypothetical protein|nr:hypothetical protein [Cytophagaceae bacterium]
MTTGFFKKFLPHLIANLAFIAVLFVYYHPTLSGKEIVSNDVVQAKGFSREADTYIKKNGGEVLWTNTSFSGMPVWVGHTTNYVAGVHAALRESLPTPIAIGFVCFIGFYVLMVVLGANAWLAFAMSAGFAFSTFNIISFEAGHINKVYDMGLMAPVLAGVWLIFQQRNYIVGALVTTFFLGLHIFYGHYQITYYLLIVLLFMGLYEFIMAIINKTYVHFAKATALVVICAIIAVAPNVSKMWTNYVYSKQTMRGGSELKAESKDNTGLDKVYALRWSSAKMESFTMFIPYFYGGASNEKLGAGSNFYKTLVANGVPRVEAKSYAEQVPLYWGDQPGTAGPLYFGAIIVFLFVLAMFVIKDQYKWWILAATLFSIVMSWGRNFETVTDFLFYNVPLYNKFRSVTMALCIAQMTVPFLGGILLVKLAKGEVEKADFYKGLKWALGICGGLALIFGLMGGAFFDFYGASDSETGYPEWLLEALRADRASKFRTDSFRTLFFVLAAAGLLWAWFTDKLNATTTYIVLALLVIIDIAWVDKRYLEASDFKKKKTDENWVEMTAADEQILRDTTLSYRVLNLSKNPFSDATTSYYHKSVGGYSAIKLSRYQDVIDNQFMDDSGSFKLNEPIFSMLNTKYIIFSDRKSGQVYTQQNPGAFGNAWFAAEIKPVKGAKEEMDALGKVDVSRVAVVEQSFDSLITVFTPNRDSSGTITLVENSDPDQLSYDYNASSEQLVVFSEVYYQPGWNAYIDDKLAPHLRVNYILRAMRVPAGKHKITFKFEPEHYKRSEQVALIGSWFFILFLAGLIGLYVKEEWKKKTA